MESRLLVGIVVIYFHVFAPTISAFNPEHLARAVAGDKHLAGYDLVRADLSWLDLSGADLQGANLKYAKLNHTNLENTLLCHAKCMHANCSLANCSGADFSYADISDAIFFTTNFFAAIFYKTRACRAHFKYCTMAEAEFDCTNLREAIFVDTDLSDVAFKDSIIDDIIIYHRIEAERPQQGAGAFCPGHDLQHHKRRNHGKIKEIPRGMRIFNDGICPICMENFVQEYPRCMGNFVIENFVREKYIAIFVPCGHCADHECVKHWYKVQREIIHANQYNDIKPKCPICSTLIKYYVCRPFEKEEATTLKEQQKTCLVDDRKS